MLAIITKKEIVESLTNNEKVLDILTTKIGVERFLTAVYEAINDEIEDSVPLRDNFELPPEWLKEPLGLGLLNLDAIARKCSLQTRITLEDSRHCLTTLNETIYINILHLLKSAPEVRQIEIEECGAITIKRSFYFHPEIFKK